MTNNTAAQEPKYQVYGNKQCNLKEPVSDLDFLRVDLQYLYV